MGDVYNSLLNKNMNKNLNNEKKQKILTFAMAGQEYGIDINYITTIIENEYPITRVPGAPKFIKGVINLRGDIVTIMELRHKLKLPSIEDTNETKIIVVNFEEIALGIKVDQVDEVVEILANSIEAITDISDKDISQYFSGLCKLNKRVIILLNIENIIKKDC